MLKTNWYMIFLPSVEILLLSTTPSCLDLGPCLDRDLVPLCWWRAAVDQGYQKWGQSSAAAYLVFETPFQSLHWGLCPFGPAGTGNRTWSQSGFSLEPGEPSMRHRVGEKQWVRKDCWRRWTTAGGQRTIRQVEIKKTWKDVQWFYDFRKKSTFLVKERLKVKGHWVLLVRKTPSSSRG